MEGVRLGPGQAEAVPVRMEWGANQEQGQAKGDNVQDVVHDASPGGDQEGLAELDAEAAVEQQHRDLDQRDADDVAPQTRPHVDAHLDVRGGRDVPDVPAAEVSPVTDDDQHVQRDEKPQRDQHE